MKYITLILMLGFLTISVSCSKSDDHDPDCVKDENYSSWEFDGEMYEPNWVNVGFGYSTYNLSVYRQPQNTNNWKVEIGTSNPNLYLYMYLEDIEGVGSYPIETKLEEDLSPSELGTFLYIEDYSFFYDEDLSIYTYFSLGETGTVEITEYDWEKGILIGSFETDLYSTFDEEEKEISGEFNINLETLDNRERPCWL